MADQAMECLLPGTTTPADPPDPRDIDELFVALMEGAYTLAGPTAEDDQCAGHCCADETVAPAVSTADSAEPIVTPDAAVAPDKTAVSAAGFSLALQSFLSGTCVSIEDNSPDAPLPFHLLKAASKPYTLDEDYASPILLHADSSPLRLSKGDRVFKAYFYQPIGKTGLRFEFWDQNWWNTGRFLADFKAWEGCPAVIVPCTLMRHFGFHLTKEKVVRKSGPSFRLSQREYDSIEASLNLRLN